MKQVNQHLSVAKVVASDAAYIVCACSEHTHLVDMVYPGVVYLTRLQTMRKGGREGPRGEGRNCPSEQSWQELSEDADQRQGLVGTAQAGSPEDVGLPRMAKHWTAHTKHRHRRPFVPWNQETAMLTWRSLMSRSKMWA